MIISNWFGGIDWLFVIDIGLLCIIIGMLSTWFAAPIAFAVFVIISVLISGIGRHNWLRRIVET